MPSRRTRSAILLPLALAAGCGGGNRDAHIALAYEHLQPTARLAQALIDSTRPGGDIAIVVQQGDTSERYRAGGLPVQVEHAAQIARTPGVVAVVGPGASRQVLISAPVYNEARIPQVVPTATSRLARGVGPWTFHLAPDDSAEGEFIGRFAAEELDARTALIFYAADEYGSGLRSGAAAALAAHGVRVLESVPVRDLMSCPATPDAGVTEVPLVDGALRNAAPDVVIIASQSVTAACVMRRVHQRLPGVRFLAGDGISDATVDLTRLRPAADSLYAVAFWHHDRSDARSRAYAARFREASGTDPESEDALVHDAIMVLAAAIREVGAEPRRIRRYLEELGVRRPAFQGVTGPVTFSVPRPATFHVVRPRDGRFVLVDPQ